MLVDKFSSLDYHLFYGYRWVPITINSVYIVNENSQEVEHFLLILYDQVDVSSHQLDGNTFPTFKGYTINKSLIIDIQQINMLPKHPEPTWETSKGKTFDLLKWETGIRLNAHKDLFAFRYTNLRLNVRDDDCVSFLR